MTARTIRTALRLLLAVAAALAWPGCGERPGAGVRADELIVFEADSLSVPFRELSDLFAQRHPGVAVKAEAAGSRDCARKIAELGRECDVFASADYDVIDSLLMPEFADFNILFATNEMGIAYTGRSSGADRIGPDNWYEVLAESGVAFGRSDPNSDPCGYRTLMTFQLAERYYGVPGLAERLAQKDGSRFVRPQATDLLALLESGEIDYIVIYRSVALQHRLRFVKLPAEIDLGSPDLAEAYGAARVTVTGKAPGQTIVCVGAPIAYSVTIPFNAPHRALAEDYVALLLSPDGQRIMRDNGQAPIVPPRAAELDRVPPSLAACFDR